MSPDAGRAGEPGGRPGAGRATRLAALPVLVVALVVVVTANIGIGAVGISPAQVAAILSHGAGIDLGVAFTEQQRNVLWAIRLPRVAVCALVGAGLAVSGAALQGIFRNPLADPGIIGVSSGAAVGAVAAILLGLAPLASLSLPLFAFAGALAATLAVYATARHQGRTEVVTLVLTGIAVNAIAGAAVGLMTYFADDQQLRTIVFWSLGSVGGATWPAVVSALPFVLAPALVLLAFGRVLDVITLGEREAAHLGVPVERTRTALIVFAAIATGATVAVAGIVGFVGLVVPHLLRLAAGPGHRLLLPASAIGGAIVLLAADLLARTVVVPAELPLGVVTALLGGPFFLWLLLRTRRAHGGWG